MKERLENRKRELLGEHSKAKQLHEKQLHDAERTFAGMLKIEGAVILIDELLAPAKEE